MVSQGKGSRRVSNLFGTSNAYYWRLIPMSQPLCKDDASLSVDIVIPVLNEAHVLRKSVETVLNFCARLSYRWQLVIVDNGSTDGTQAVATALIVK